jgi:peptidoglycan/LPS O-acetylase OafA/YrhL
MNQTFRNDIQGLRGISVLLVVLYHTNTLFLGGFVGVDVFFVISGYVIMTSLLNEYKQNSSISLKNFISRRINRLLPASTVVVIFTLLTSIFVFSPFSEQGQIARTSLSSTFFSANLYFILQNSYSALINNPFRHMWSLGVEEQFYVFLILSIALIFRFSRNKKSIPNRIFGFVIATCLISFLANLVFAAGIRVLPLPTRIAFFSPLTRIWELQIGVIAAFISTRYLQQLKRSLTMDFLAVCGIVLIFYSAIKFNSFTAFPGPYALAPTIGALLIVLFSGRTKVVVHMLSTKPLKYLGDVSYSWYLWHWPIIVFCQILAPGNKTLLVLSGIMSVIPASISYHFVENHFLRKNRQISPFPFSTLSISISSQVLIACLVIAGASTTYGLKLQTLTGATSSWAYNAGCQATEPIFPIDTCLVKGTNEDTTVLLIGDSQAGSVSDGVKAAAESLDINFAVWYNDGCPVFPRPTLERSDCEAYLKALPELINRLSPSVIMIANKSTLYTTGGAQRGGLTITEQDGQLPKTYSESIEMWIQGLEAQFFSAPFKEEQILLIQQVPPSKRVSPTLLNKNLSNYTFDIDSDPDRNKLVRDESSSLSIFQHVKLFDPADSICPNGSCTIAESGRSLYSDEFHLSPFGALQLKDQLIDALKLLISAD